MPTGEYHEAHQIGHGLKRRDGKSDSRLHDHEQRVGERKKLGELRGQRQLLFLIIKVWVPFFELVT
jgi:hypothetical protein